MAEIRRWRDVRLHNLDAVLTALSRRGPSTRNALAEATGLHKTSIASLVDELTDLGAPRVRPPTGAGGCAGRPAEIVELGPGAPAGLGLEISAERLVAYVCDFAG